MLFTPSAMASTAQALKTRHEYSKARLQNVLAVVGRRYCSTSYAIDSIGHIKKPTEARASPNQAKNHVTSRVRLDEKYATRRALLDTE